MAGRRRTRVQDDPLADLVMVSILIVALLGFTHRLPHAMVSFGHALMMALPGTMTRSIVAALPRDHADLADLLPYVALLVLLLCGLAGWGEHRRNLHVRTLGDMLALAPDEFEEAVCGILRTQGYSKVQRVGGPGDLSADITARDRHGKLVVAQCKRHAPGQRIGSPAIQTFIGMMTVHHKAERGIFVTTSSYTAQARDLARQHGIALWDGSDLVRLVTQGQQRGTRPDGVQALTGTGQ